MVERRLDEMNSPGAHSLLWSIWASGHTMMVSVAFTKWLQLHVDLSDMSTAVDVLLMDAEWRRCNDERFWLTLLAPASRSGTPRKVIEKWTYTIKLPDWVRVGSETWDMSKVERNRPELAKYL